MTGWARGRGGRRGFSLAEVLLGAFILATSIAIVYRVLSRGAVSELETTKLAMARKILESVRQELQSQNFAFIKGNQGASYDGTKTKVAEVQRQYKDFVLDVTFTEQSGGKVLQVKGKVTFSGANNKPREETMTFVLVEP